MWFDFAHWVAFHIIIVTLHVLSRYPMLMVINLDWVILSSLSGPGSIGLWSCWGNTLCSGCLIHPYFCHAIRGSYSIFFALSATSRARIKMDSSSSVSSNPTLTRIRSGSTPNWAAHSSSW